MYTCMYTCALFIDIHMMLFKYLLYSRHSTEKKEKSKIKDISEE